MNLIFLIPRSLLFTFIACKIKLCLVGLKSLDIDSDDDARVRRNSCIESFFEFLCLYLIIFRRTCVAKTLQEMVKSIIGPK